jgi:mycofactocin precursor
MLAHINGTRCHNSGGSPLERMLMNETPTDLEAAPAVEQTEALQDDTLIEDVSIDGMCGVY